MSTTNPNDFLFEAGAKSAFGETAEIGDIVKGRIVSAEVRQQTDGEGNPRFWSDGKPRQQLVIVIQTDQGDGDADDGQRALYAKDGKFEVASGKGQAMLTAIREAVKKVGGKGLDVGATLTVQFSGLGKKTSPGFSPPKLYLAKYEPAGIPVDDLI